MRAPATNSPPYSCASPLCHCMCVHTHAHRYFVLDTDAPLPPTLYSCALNPKPYPPPHTHVSVCTQAHRYFVLDIDVCLRLRLGAGRVSRQLQSHLEAERDRLRAAAESRGGYGADATPVLVKHEAEYKAVFGVIRTAEVGWEVEWDLCLAASGFGWGAVRLVASGRQTWVCEKVGGLLFARHAASGRGCRVVLEV